jgi:hypothetical protein
MATITGRATIFGFIGDHSWTGIGTLFNESAEISDEFTLTQLKDGDSVTQGLIASDPNRKMRLQFTPVSSSGTNTLANAALSLPAPAPLSRVTLTNYKDTTLNHARWVYTGGWKVGLKKDGLATYELEIMCSKDSNIDLSAPVS